ncbi:hypothetical protein AGLY_016332 [Aphis glycines]|uniref:TTF-type domain-containing protein n=1 Tax=Aphis glycines TaxID=307491 RepID=A0A6G0SZJ9_APHGL|nr:hypothetical protein AGLY_016332 [Aphis glycines]
MLLMAKDLRREYLQFVNIYLKFEPLTKLPKQLHGDIDSIIHYETDDEDIDNDEEKNKKHFCTKNTINYTYNVFYLIGLKDILPSIYEALSIALTLPVSSASPERAFSKLKLIKTKLRSTMGEERLESLMLISCKKDITLCPYEIINTFSNNSDCKFKRKWLTCDENNQMLFCSVCLAYSNGSSTFCSGFNDWKHTNQRIKEHEISKHHNLSVKAYIREKREKTVQHLLCGEQLKKRKIEIIEVIKLIGKQVLPFRGIKSEAAYKLDDSSINHSNFLEIILLLSKFDNILKSHIEKSIKLSKEHHDRAQNINMKLLKTTTKIGRENLVTFLSATTITTIIQLIGNEIKNIISREVKKGKIFSVMMDTTVDLSSYDQCSIVLRYVPHNEVYERLIGLKHVTSTSGNSLFETLKDTLAELDLPLNNCVANAFDGAANMNGQYNGVTAKLSEVIANHVHTWCYALVLN